MNRSPLHDSHVGLGARFVDFGGWEMPVQYESVLAEHRAVRNAAGVFDVSHLGRFELTGQGAHQAIRRLLCNDIDRVEPGRCQYTMILNEDAGIIDDLIVWWWEPGRYWVMPNAANHDRVALAFDAEEGCKVDDLQTDTVFLAVQGPDAPRMLETVLGAAPKRFRNLELDWEGETVGLAGTGYTGERGAEICATPIVGRALLERLLEVGAVPCGLGARDTLRLEAGLALWGEDIDETTTPLEAGLDFAVSFDHEFIGHDRLAAQRDGGVERRLAGLVLEERGIPRHGHAVATETGGVGQVTSGNLSPMLDTGVALAYISPPAQVGEKATIEIRGRPIPAHIAKPPFHEE